MSNVKARSRALCRALCYYASAVNYSLWGKMNSLVHDYLIQGGNNGGKLNSDDYSLLSASKLMLEYKHKIYNDYGETSKQALGFTIYGYSGYTNFLKGLKCKPSGETVTYPTFLWMWQPNKQYPPDKYDINPN